MVSYWWEVFWFFLPAGLANIVPVFVSRAPILRHWKTPIDMGKHYQDKRILGPNKTWRGLVSGALFAGLFSLFQYRFVAYGSDTTAFYFFAGCALGLGALVGDAVESFFKRRRHIPSGDPWFPFDQTDYIVGGLLFVYPFIRPSISIMLSTIALYLVLHLVFSYIGFLLGLKDKPY